MPPSAAQVCPLCCRWRQSRPERSRGSADCRRGCFSRAWSTPTMPTPPATAPAGSAPCRHRPVGTSGSPLWSRTSPIAGPRQSPPTCRSTASMLAATSTSSASPQLMKPRLMTSQLMKLRLTQMAPTVRDARSPPAKGRSESARRPPSSATFCGWPGGAAFAGLSSSHRTPRSSIRRSQRFARHWCSVASGQRRWLPPTTAASSSNSRSFATWPSYGPRRSS